LTKRKILSKLAAIFDPFGVAAAIVIKSKIALQELWQLGLKLDDELPSASREKWIRMLSDVKFDRCLTPSEAFGKPCLIVFCYASRLEFGAVTRVL
jgi:hypothetical protein